MKKYGKLSSSARNSMKFTKEYSYKEGVFKGWNDKYIVRVRVGIKKTFSTLSVHNNKEEADIAWENFKNNRV